MSEGQRRILVVDDNADIRILLCRNLQLSGYETSMAESGEEALSLIQAQAFDAVVSDILMPQGSGTWLVQKVRETQNTIPIFLISASSDFNRSEVMAIGATGFFKKPLEIAQLEKALEDTFTH